MRSHRYSIHQRQYIYRDGVEVFWTADPIMRLTVTPDAFYVDCVPSMRQSEKVPYPPPGGSDRWWHPEGQYCGCCTLDGELQWILIEGNERSAGSVRIINEPTIRYAKRCHWSVRVEDHHVFFKEPCVFQGRAAVKTVLRLDGQLYLLTEDEEEDTNVYCISEQAEFLWRIEPRQSAQVWYNVDPVRLESYKNICCRHGAPWVTTSTSGYACRLDPKTGRIVENVLTRE
jgi:hypothetical protein